MELLGVCRALKDPAELFRLFRTLENFIGIEGFSMTFQDTLGLFMTLEDFAGL